MDELKKGYYVKCKDSVKESCDKSFQRYFEGVKQINGISTDIFGRTAISLTEEDTFFYLPEELELVCGFVKGQEIQVSDSLDYWGRRIFYAYDSDLEYPYLIIDNCGGISNWQYARAIGPEYVPYTEPKLEWVIKPKQIIIKDPSIRGFSYEIYGFKMNEKVWEVLIKNIETKEKDSVTFKQMFDWWEWVDGTTCGDLKE